MRHRLPHELLSLTRDQLRHMRYLIRSEARRGTADRTGRGAANPAALLADAFFSSAEQVASSVLSGMDSEADGPAAPRQASSYFASGDERQERRQFVRAHYRLASELLAQFGARNVLVSEAAIDMAYDDLMERHADLIWSRPEPGCAIEQHPSIAVSAAIAVRLAVAKPIQRFDLDSRHEATPQHLLIEANRFVFLVAGLATAIISARPDGAGLDRDEVLASATDVVDLRFDRFAAAFRSRDRVGALTSEFAALVPHLP